MKIYIQSNNFNKIGALVSKYSFQKFNPEYPIDLINMEDYKKLMNSHMKIFYRSKNECYWRKDLHQSFFPTRFFAPEKSNYEGWCLVVDPDIFAMKDISSIEQYINDETPICCYYDKSSYHTSMMLLNNTKLKNWNEEYVVNFMFHDKKNFDDLILLKNLSTINNTDVKQIPRKYNQLNTYHDDTIMCHMSRTNKQPWKTGIKYCKCELHNSKKCKKCNVSKVFGKFPDKKCETYFFQLAHEAYTAGYFTRPEIDEAIKNKWIRKDFYEIMTKSQNN